MRHPPRRLFHAGAFSSLMRRKSSPSPRVPHCQLVRHKSGEKKRYFPLSENTVPEFGDIATFMRLPLRHRDPSGLDACFVGIPMDHGTSLRSGTRHGPRAVRNESSIIGPYSRMTGAAPFESLQVADIGDVPVNPYNLKKTIENITEHYKLILSAGCTPLGIGGDHTLSLGVLRALREAKGRPLAMVHVDAHADVTDSMFGEKLAHGTPFRRAVEEGLIDPHRVIQIGLRGGGYSNDDYDWPQEQVRKNIYSYLMSTCWARNNVPSPGFTIIQLYISLSAVRHIVVSKKDH